MGIGFVMKWMYADLVYQSITKREISQLLQDLHIKYSNIDHSMCSKTDTNLFLLVQQEGAMAQESPKNSAAEIPVTSNGQLEDSHEHSFNRVRAFLSV